MNKHFFLILLSFPLFVTAQNRFVINNVSVLDMTDSIVKPGKTVIIEGNKISFIGKNSKIPVGATIVDGAGKFLIPGLWDMHVHICHERWEKSIPAIEAREVFLNSFIPNGITGIRDMGGDQKQIRIWKEQIRQGKRIGPLIVAGPIVDGPEKLREDYISISTPEEAVQTVKTLQNDGVDFIKVYTTLPRDVYFALAKECNLRHIDFEGHLPALITATEAAEAGQKTIEHTGWMPLSCSSKEDSMREAMASETRGSVIDSALIERFKTYINTYSQQKLIKLSTVFKRNDVWLCPTLKVSYPNLWRSKEPYFSDERIKYIPTWMQKLLDIGDLKAGVPETFMPIRKQWFEHLQKLVGEFHRQGISLLAGTDCPALSFPGSGLHEELELLVRAGLSPFQSLKTATVNPAKFLHREKDLGTIERGKIANFVLLDASPLENISNTKKIYAVIVNGKLLPRKELDQMLNYVKELAAK